MVTHLDYTAILMQAVAKRRQSGDLEDLQRLLNAPTDLKRASKTFAEVIKSMVPAPEEGFPMLTSIASHASETSQAPPGDSGSVVEETASISASGPVGAQRPDEKLAVPSSTPVIP